MQKEMEIYVVVTLSGVVLRCFYSFSAAREFHKIKTEEHGSPYFRLQESVVELQESEGE